MARGLSSIDLRLLIIPAVISKLLVADGVTSSACLLMKVTYRSVVMLAGTVSQP